MVRKVKEQEPLPGNLPEGVALPFHPLCRLCRNSMTDVCIESCAKFRTLEWFEPKKIEGLIPPPFPIEAYKRGKVSPEAQVLAIYIKWILNYIGWE